MSPITLLDAVADRPALPAGVDAWLAALRGKFSQVPGIGIGDGDVATDAAIAGTKFSNVSTRQIPEDRIGTNSGSSRALASDATVSANRAITDNHVQSATLTKRSFSKTAGSILTASEVAFVVDTGPVQVGVGILPGASPSLVSDLIVVAPSVGFYLPNIFVTLVTSDGKVHLGSADAFNLMTRQVASWIFLAAYLFGTSVTVSGGSGQLNGTLAVAYMARS